MPSTTSDSAGPRADEPLAKAPHLDSIRVGLPSDRAIAEILGVSPSQVSRWRRGQAPDMENADRLAGLALVVEMLSRWLSTEVIEEWLTGPNAHLDGRTPAYHVRRGQLAEVVGAVEAMKAGTFA
jgi:transcriptional regulator with XRE-family HTH domain